MKIVVYGANDIGCLIATQLFEDHDITVIDDSEDRIEEFNKLDISFIYGNGSDIKNLEAAQIKEADIFIACTDVEEANIVSCLIVKSLSSAKTVCFIRKEEYQESLTLIKESEIYCKIAINYLIWPEKLLTQEIYRIITVPKAINVENFADGKGRLLEYRIKEDSAILGKKIRDCHFPGETLIVGITRDCKLFIPDGETTLMANDKIIFMGSMHSLDMLSAEFFSQKNKIKDVAIIGGGTVGLMLARQLERFNINIKIIESNYKRCEYLSGVLKKTLVIHGDGTNFELLESENIEENEVVVCVTNNDEKNLLCALLTKQLDVKKVITRVSNYRNADLFEKVGIDVAISPNSAAIDEIQRNLIQTDVAILSTVQRGQGEIIEISLPETFKSVKIMDLKFPEKAIIAIIKRHNKIIIPKGDISIMPYDDLLIFTRQEHSTKIKEFFNKI